MSFRAVKRRNQGPVQGALQRVLQAALLAAWLGLVGLWPGLAQAALPADYQPLVLEPRREGPLLEFDLDPALQRARQQGKPLYVYLGAHDCSFCRRYEAFLAGNTAALVPEFAARYLVVELRSSLRTQAQQLRFRVNGRSLGYLDWMRELGDERVRQLVYPSVWLLDTAGRNLMQMPAGTGTFETVQEQIEVLRLVQ